MALPVRSPAEMLMAELQAQGLPVLTVFCGTNDRSTWVITLKPTATAQQIAAAETIRQIFDPSSQPAQDVDKVRRRDHELWTPQILALTRAIHDRIRAANVDNQQMSVFRAAIEVHYEAIVNPVQQAAVVPAAAQPGMMARVAGWFGFGGNSGESA